MSYDIDLALADILRSCLRIERYVGCKTFEQFCESEIVVDAVFRNLEVIGHSLTQLAKSYRFVFPELDWDRILIISEITQLEFLGIEEGLVWDIIKNVIPELFNGINTISANLKR